jgi:hypothetical protein
LLGFTFALAIVRAVATVPTISLIQLFSTNQVLIHFDTDANRKYELQFINSLPTNAVNQWTNLFVAPAFPSPDHYVVPDTRTTPKRFYRLRVTP